MTRGVVIFAYNNNLHDYYSMAEFTARRVNHFLDLPVTLVTDEFTYSNKTDYKWDKVSFVDSNKTNNRANINWLNKGRYNAYDSSPYDETIVLDSDYIVNSDKLNKIFEIYDDFMCHNSTNFLMYQDMPNEKIAPNSFDMLWATVMCFRKTNRAKQIFECLKMVQHNYDHYANIHGFVSEIYRNDIALTLALRIVNGHLVNNNDFIPWALTHIGTNTVVHKNNDDTYNTEYTVLFDNYSKPKVKKEYLLIKDYDFHVLDKFNVKDIINVS